MSSLPESEIVATVSETIAPAEEPTDANELQVPWQSIDRRWVSADRISGGILMTVLSIISLVVYIVLVTTFFYGQLWLSLGLGLMIVTGLLAAGWLIWNYPWWAYEATSWREVHNGFEIRRGIWWRHHIYIPRERIQHTDVMRGPINRKFGLAMLIIHTAGTHNHQIPLEGLEYQTAERLRQSLLPRDHHAI